MPRRDNKNGNRESKKPHNKAEIENAGAVFEQHITKTLEVNFMPYAMSVIVSRAIPEIDGFKPSHRKLLYTMYDMGLLTGPRSKSANVVGQTMKLNPHSDAAIYETMVLLSRGYAALLHPYVDSKGNFGKAYSRDMAYAASRYTEVKLDAICAELFRDIDSNTVDFVDNYDNKMKEPTLLPVTYPSVLVNANTGIAVGMASSICSFNLAEVCETAIKLIKNPDYDVSATLRTWNDRGWLAEETLMVGDTDKDIFLGKNAGVDTCGVTYGCLSNEQLLKFSPDHIVENFSELLSLV